MAIVQMFELGATREEVLEASKKWGANGVAPSVNNVIEQILSEDLVESISAPAAAAPDISVTTWVLPVLSKHKEPLQRIMVSAFDPGMPLAE